MSTEPTLVPRTLASGERLTPAPDPPGATSVPIPPPEPDPRADDPPGVVVVYVAGLNTEGTPL